MAAIWVFYLPNCMDIAGLANCDSLTAYLCISINCHGYAAIG